MTTLDLSRTRTSAARERTDHDATLPRTDIEAERRGGSGGREEQEAEGGTNPPLPSARVRQAAERLDAAGLVQSVTVDKAFEDKVGSYALARELGGASVVDAPPAVRDYVEGMVEKLAEASGRPDLVREVVFTSGGNPSIRTVADGTLIVPVEMLRGLGGGDALAGVLAHEIVHVDRRHPLRMYAWNVIADHGALEKQGFTPDEVNEARAYLSRQLEIQADVLGVALLRRAGFDPAGMHRALSDGARLQAEYGKQEEAGTALAGHPDVRDRIARVRGLVASSGPPPDRPRDDGFDDMKRLLP